MDCAESQVVFIQKRIGRKFLGGAWRVQCHLRQKFSSALISSGDGFQLNQIIQSSLHIVVLCLQQRRVKQAGCVNISGDSGVGFGSLFHFLKQTNELRPVVLENRRRGPRRPGLEMATTFAQVVQQRSGFDMTDAGHQNKDSKTGNGVQRVFRESKKRHQITNMSSL